MSLAWPAALPVVAAPVTVSAGSPVYVNVTVATLWVTPQSPRAVDAAALSRPVHIRRWLHAMSTDVRRDLVGRIETQALYGERLLVVGEQGRWLHVVATGQPTHRDSRGYPGWLPRRQVTTRAPTRTDELATVIQPTAQMRRPDGSGGGVVSFGTRLPVLGVSAGLVTVATPAGGRRTIMASDVALAARAEPARPQTVRSVMREGRKFLGVPYLWGGRSGFAVDCSGFTNLVYGVHGIRLPRDADDQAETGAAVPLADMRAGDLAFFSAGSGVSHVGFITRHRRLLNAPRTGQSVSVTDLASRAGLVAARRYV
jgi:cell wall-associated NlpC family hydrolase